MFHFHGWVVIAVDDLNDEDVHVVREQENRIEAAIHAMLPTVYTGNNICELRHTGNNLRVLSVHGLHNHRQDAVIHLYTWIADRFPACYGLLYIWDDEDTQRTGSDYSNCFRVWRLVRGQVTEENDPFLSPCIPTIELPLNRP
jgi:hypothetical protein